MYNSRQIYDRIDNKIKEMSRIKYAVLTGFTAALTALIVSLGLGDPNYIFSVTIGITLTILNYLSHPNQD